MATTSSMPRSVKVAIAMRPIGPQPNTATLSPGWISAWFTACIPTANGSASAAVVSDIPSGTGNRRLDLATSRTKSIGASPPASSPLPMEPPPISDGHTITRSPTSTSVTSRPIHSTTPAISWPSGIGSWLRPPMWIYETSLPQMPHAAMRTTASESRGVGLGTSSNRQSYGACTRICFIDTRPSTRTK